METIFRDKASTLNNYDLITLGITIYNDFDCSNDAVSVILKLLEERGLIEEFDKAIA